MNSLSDRHLVEFMASLLDAVASKALRAYQQNRYRLAPEEATEYLLWWEEARPRMTALMERLHRIVERDEQAVAAAEMLEEIMGENPGVRTLLDRETDSGG